MGSQLMIRCRGACKRQKPAFLFSPAQARSKRPVCIRCMKTANQKYSRPTGRPRGWNWRIDPITFPGSGAVA